MELATEPLRSEIHGARWTARKLWHVTLKFFGEVPEDRLPEVQEVILRAVKGTGKVESYLTDIGAFPNLNRARVLWVGIADPAHALQDLAARVEAGWPDGRYRPLHAHLTLARFNHPGRVRATVDKFRPFDFDRSPFSIDKATLYRSHLGRGGPLYEPLQEFSLE